MTDEERMEVAEQRIEAAAQSLCARFGDWRWDQITEAKKNLYRFAAQDALDAYEEGEPIYPLFYDVGIGISYGGAGTPAST